MTKIHARLFLCGALGLALVGALSVRSADVLAQDGGGAGKEGRAKPGDDGKANDNGRERDKAKDKDKDDRGRKDDETRPVRYSFPTAVPGVDLGRAVLEKVITDKQLDGPAVVELLFADFELIGWAGVIRGRLGAKELQGLDRELDEADLASLVQANRSKPDREFAAALEEAKLSARDFERGMGKVFEDWRGNETAAYFARMGYAEAWMSRRLHGLDRVGDAQKKLQDLRERELENPRKLLEGDFAPATYAELVQLWLGLPGRPDKREIEYIFREEEKVLTPDILRVLAFRDIPSSVTVLNNAGLSFAAFRDRLFEYWDKVEKDDGAAAKRLAGALAVRFEKRLNAAHDWLYGGGSEIKAVYSGDHSQRRGTPVLGALEGDGAEAAKLPDLGISESIAGYFGASGGFLLVLFTNDSVRATSAGIRLEGKLDRETGKLDLMAVYGGRDLKFTGVKLHGGGLIMELSVAEEPAETAKRMLRRSAGW